MHSFVDETTIEVASGDGGAGSVHFRREKYVPRGGPDGGDGGKGGDVVFVVKENLKTLSHLRYKKKYKAGGGEAGMGKRKHGKDGEDVEIAVPPGTVIKEYETGKIIKDLDETGERFICLYGGKGGLGNYHFATSTNRAPRYAQPGIPGGDMVVVLELRIIADIGFVGFPNAGKSTLLQFLSNAHPKIGAYPFTTKIPNLGVLHGGYTDIILADIPGLLEGASKGVGLGHAFLKHITRTRGLAYIIDCSDDNCLNQYPVLREECGAYTPSLLDKKYVIIGTKLDLPGAEEHFQNLGKQFSDAEVVGVSAFARSGISEVKQALLRLAEAGRKDGEDV